MKNSQLQHDGHVFSSEPVELSGSHLVALMKRAEDVPSYYDLTRNKDTATTEAEIAKLTEALWDRASLDHHALQNLGAELLEEWDRIVSDFRRVSSEVARTDLPLIVLLDRAADIDRMMRNSGRDFWVSTEERTVMLRKMRDAFLNGSIWQAGPEDDVEYWIERRDASTSPSVKPVAA